MERVAGAQATRTLDAVINANRGCLFSLLISWHPGGRVKKEITCWMWPVGRQEPTLLSNTSERERRKQGEREKERGDRSGVSRALHFDTVSIRPAPISTGADLYFE